MSTDTYVYHIPTLPNEVQARVFKFGFYNIIRYRKVITSQTFINILLDTIHKRSLQNCTQDKTQLLLNIYQAI